MRPDTQQLIRLIIIPKIKAAKANLDVQKTYWELVFGEYGIVTTLEENLTKTNAYICGSSPTVADIAIYCELVTVVLLTKQTADDFYHRKLLQTYRWYTKLSEYPFSQEINGKL